MRSKGNLSKIILKRSSEPKDSWQYHKGSMRTKTSLEKVVKSQKQGFFLQMETSNYIWRDTYFINNNKIKIKATIQEHLRLIKYSTMEKI